MSAERIELPLTEDGGLKKVILQPGTEDISPEKGDRVTVHYTGRLLQDGTVFDSSVERNEPFVFKLGKGEVIKGWDLGVASMKKGEKALLICRSDYAYGKAGSPPKIPADAILEFEVELISWVSKSDIMGDGGIIKKTIKSGGVDKKPSTGNEVSIHYVGKFSDGKVFDSSRERNEKLTWILGEDESVLKCFNETVKKMTVGDVFEIKVKPQYAYGEKGHEKLGVPANADVIFEIELLEFFDITEVVKDVVKMKTLKEGEKWSRPDSGNTVEIKLKGWVSQTNQTFLIIDQPTKFVLGNGDLPEAVDLSLEKMKKGEISLVTVNDSDYCYSREVTQSKGIPEGKHTLMFEIELVDFTEPEKKAWEFNLEERVEAAKVSKELGNQFFKGGRLRQAKKKYKAALDHLDSQKVKDGEKTPEQDKAIKELLISCRLNQAATEIKLGDYKSAVEHCDKALEIDKANIKALFRRATGLYQMGRYEKAKADLLKANELSPNDKEIKALLAEIVKKLKEFEQKDKKIFSGLFEKLAAENEREAKKKKAEDKPEEKEKKEKLSEGEKVQEKIQPNNENVNSIPQPMEE